MKKLLPALLLLITSHTVSAQLDTLHVLCGGKWQVTKIINNRDEKETGVRWIILHSDKTFTAKDFGSAGTGTWSYNSTKKVLTLSGGDFQRIFTVKSIANNELELFLQETSGEIFEIRMKRIGK